MLAAYHRAFACELRAMMSVLPIELGQTVLDVACGDGAYSPWLAERVGAGGRVVAVDIDPTYLEAARAEAARSPNGSVIEFVAAPVEAMPFDAGTFDLAWCAQSLYSLPEPVAALRHMMRAVKPGGIVAVLEADTLHHVILPWPVEVELSVRAAELAAIVERSREPEKFYVGRRLRSVFHEAGLEGVTVRSFASDRAHPLGADDRTFFAETLKRLAGKVRDRLAPAMRDQFAALADPESVRFLPDDPEFAATCIDHVVWGRVPGRNAT